jgi:thiol:disulfide interchange protein DsbA
MKRRDFSLVCGAAVAGSAWLQSAALAQVRPPVAGTDYMVLDKPVAVDAPAGKVEVVEFFGYFCPHCNAFEPIFDAWVKRAPKYVVVKRIPVAFQGTGPQQRLFYALEALGLLDTLHRKAFSAIHVEKQRLDTPEAISDWVVKQGVDKVKFMEQFNSFSTNTKASRAARLQDEYKIEGVPTLGVAGRYLTDGTMARSMDRALQVVDFLANMARTGH